MIISISVFRSFFLYRISLISSLFFCITGCGVKEFTLSERPYQEVRNIQSLNGVWEIEEGDLIDTPPSVFSHKITVPSLVSSAFPSFQDVGISSPLRQAFWYRLTFTAPLTGEVAILNIHKAKYGLKVWLNGDQVGEHLGPFTLASFDVTRILKWGGENLLLVRLGDYKDKIPDYIPAGMDIEKDRWIPGIYDDVEIITTGIPFIVRVKIEPDIDRGIAKVKTTIQNPEDRDISVSVENHIVEWESGKVSSKVNVVDVKVPGGEEITAEQNIKIMNPHLWSPEDPFLYELRTALRRDGIVVDNLETPFGMRKVEWRGGKYFSGRFYLNNKLYYLRGSNITLHRFFEDEESGRLPWDRQWVRKLFSTYPKQLHWNTFRICIGRAPNFWYDIADEVGFLLADEYMMWTLGNNVADKWSIDSMEEEYKSWIQENWNHPSIAWWDASNETYHYLSTEVISRVRELDPTRQWENGGYNHPQSENDPIEDHPYLFMGLPFIGSNYDIRFLDYNDGKPPQGALINTPLGTVVAPDHPYYINEYGALWLNRDGTSTVATQKTYENIFKGKSPTVDEYREAYAYLVGGLTEFWRARRWYAGILHFVYLGYSKENGVTGDNFVDVKNLILEPRFLEYAKNAFSPLMVYIDSWREDYKKGENETIPLVIINDLDSQKKGEVKVMAVDISGNILEESESQGFVIEPYGRIFLNLPLKIPEVSKYIIYAKLEPEDKTLDTVWSRRKIGFNSPGEKGPDPTEIKN